MQNPNGQKPQKSAFRSTAAKFTSRPADREGQSEVREDTPSGEESDSVSAFEVLHEPSPQYLNGDAEAPPLAAFEIDPSEEDFEAEVAPFELSVRAPNETEYVRVSDPIARLRCIRRKINVGTFSKWEYYIATKHAARAVPSDAGDYDLVVWVGQQGGEGALLLPVKARDSYHTTLRAFADRGRTRWVRFCKKDDRFTVMEAGSDLGTPTFRELEKEKVVDAVFGSRRITDEAHPVICALLGIEP